MRRIARTDANQREIVSALRDVGASVQVLSAVGSGCPDLLVGFRDETFLLECKDGAKSPSRQRLTIAEAEWFEEWRGKPPAIVTSIAEALRMVGLTCDTR